MSEELVSRISYEVSGHFRCFGGGRTVPDGNPLTAIFEGKAPVFALGVDVEEVVRYVVRSALAAKDAEIARLRDALKEVRYWIVKSGAAHPGVPIGHIDRALTPPGAEP